MKHYFTTLILIMCIPALMFAQTTYYVTPTGDDGNNGSVGSPWRTIQHAINVADISDIIEVATGTYTETLSIAKPLTINGAAGTIVKPPDYDPGKIINGYSNPLVRIFIPERKSALPEKSSSGAVTITGIEFDCDFHPSITAGIDAIYYDLVFDNIKVHSILQEGYDVFGININNTGSIAITNSEIYDIISTTEEEYSYAAVGIHIIGSQDFPDKSLHDEYDIVITDNELYGIVSEGADYQTIFLDEGSRAIQINYASNVLISGNNIYSTSTTNTPQKDLPEDPSLAGPSTGIFLVELYGYNTVATNAFSYIPMAGLFVETPFIVVEDNEVSKSYIGFVGFGEPPQSEDGAKSASPIPHINLKLPVISPLKTNKSMSGGTWEFNNNRFDVEETSEMKESFGIVILNSFDGSAPLKNAESLDVKISGNDIQQQIVGILIQNLGPGWYEVTDNVFRDNYLGLIVQNNAEAGMMLDVYDNAFIDNLFLGMNLSNYETIIADIYQNLFEGNGIGLVFNSVDYTTISANNNQIINNRDYGISIGGSKSIGGKNDSSSSLDATCNWWGTIDPRLITAMVKGDVDVFPYLLSDVTDPNDPAFICGQDFTMIPLSNHGLLLSILLIAGFSLFMLRARPL